MLNLGCHHFLGKHSLGGVLKDEYLSTSPGWGEGSVQTVPILYGSSQCTKCRRLVLKFKWRVEFGSSGRQVATVDRKDQYQVARASCHCEGLGLDDHREALKKMLTGEMALSDVCFRKPF